MPFDIEKDAALIPEKMGRDVTWLVKFYKDQQGLPEPGLPIQFFVKRFLDGWEKYWGPRGRALALAEVNQAFEVIPGAPRFENETWWSAADYEKHGVTQPGVGASV